MPDYPSDMVFTPAVKGIQAAKGSRGGYARMEAGGGWETRVTADLVEFLAGRHRASRNRSRAMR